MGYLERHRACSSDPIGMAYQVLVLCDAVRVTIVINLVRDEEGKIIEIEGPDGVKRPQTAYEAHFSEKPDVGRLFPGPFGALSYLILSEEQRAARSYTSSLGVRAIAGIYLGCEVDPKSGTYHHLITDGRSIFSSPNRIKVIPDVFPGAYEEDVTQPDVTKSDEMALASIDPEIDFDDPSEKTDDLASCAERLRMLLAEAGQEEHEQTWLMNLTAGKADDDRKISRTMSAFRLPTCTLMSDFYRPFRQTSSSDRHHLSLIRRTRPGSIPRRFDS